MKVIVHEIEWDTSDDYEDEDTREFCVPDIPTGNIEVDVPDFVVDGLLDEEDMNNAVGDWLGDYLSDIYGYCHNSFSWDFV